MTSEMIEENGMDNWKRIQIITQDLSSLGE